jgi:predicted transcriptional regulator
MSLRPLDTTIAHKAINLTWDLSGTDKRVAGAIIDSFNRKTGQCDPSLGRIAGLLGISRRTVIRAVQRLEKLRLIRKRRHGGHSHRNSYEPNWVLFRELDAQWSVRFRTKSGWSTNVATSECQSCRYTGDADGTQTCLINQPKETRSDAASSAKEQPSEPMGRKGQPIKEEHSDEPRQARSGSPKNGELLERYSETPNVYAAIIDAITPELQRDATEAEMHKRGAGIALVLEQLQSAKTDATEAASKAGATRVCQP